MKKVYALIEALIQLGEDRDELEFWKSLYPNMPPDEQRELITNLEKEIKEINDSRTKDTAPRQ